MSVSINTIREMLLSEDLETFKLALNILENHTIDDATEEDLLPISMNTLIRYPEGGTIRYIQYTSILAYADNELLKNCSYTNGNLNKFRFLPIHIKYTSGFFNIDPRYYEIIK